MRIVTLTIVSWLLAIQSGAAQDQSGRGRPCAPEILPTLGGPNTSVFAINNRGQVAGSSYIADATGQITGQHAFLWEHGRPMQELQNAPGTQISLALALNDSGLIVGNAIPAGAPGPVPVAWVRGSLVKLPLSTTPVNGGAATATNNRGLIVGAIEGSHCLLWKDTRTLPVELANLGGTSCSPHAINDQGIIVGEATKPDGTLHAVMWRDGKLVDLGGSLPFSAANDINNSTQTVGVVTTDSTNTLHPAEWNRDRSLTVFDSIGLSQSINEPGDIAVFDNPGSQDSRLIVIDRRGAVHDMGLAGGIPVSFFINDGRQATWTAADQQGGFHSYFCQMSN
jgi:probable HAF family extracellular repeat protein